MDERNRSVQVRDSEGSSALAGVRPDSFAAFARAIKGAGAGAPAGSRLAIDALPDEVAQLAPGHFYAIYAKPHTTACDALIWNTAKAAHTRHVPTHVVTHDNRVFPLYMANVLPLTVLGSSAFENVRTTLKFPPKPVAPSDGVTEVTVGGVVSEELAVAKE